MIEINEAIARKVLETVDAGLVKGVGNPVPGHMCVEAAVCYAMGLPHGDNPSCVSPALRALKIKLNDSNWASNEARAKGLRKLAVAQLGSAGVLDDVEFIKRVAEMAIRVIVPIALRAAASKQTDKHHQERLEQCAARCEIEGTKAAAEAASEAASEAAASYASYASHASSCAAAAAADAYAAAFYTTTAAEAAAEATAEDRAKVLTLFADEVVAILVKMGAPGCQWLTLCDDHETVN